MKDTRDLKQKLFTRFKAAVLQSEFVTFNQSEPEAEVLRVTTLPLPFSLLTFAKTQPVKRPAQVLKPWASVSSATEVEKLKHRLDAAMATVKNSNAKMLPQSKILLSQSQSSQKTEKMKSDQSDSEIQRMVAQLEATYPVFKNLQRQLQNGFRHSVVSGCIKHPNGKAISPLVSSLVMPKTPLQNTHPLDDFNFNFNDTLALSNQEGQLPNLTDAHFERQGDPHQVVPRLNFNDVFYEWNKSGGRMTDLSRYKDLSRVPVVSDDDDDSINLSTERTHVSSVNHHPLPAGLTSAGLNTGRSTFTSVPNINAENLMNDRTPLLETEFSGNVQTLIRLVSELPEGVTKQTGAQIIRLTMEAMGISMEEVLSEAQSAQSEMLDAVRANIKKIEEFKTVIRKLESDIKFYQGKANELSEIIDLFILSNSSPGRIQANIEDINR